MEASSLHLIRSIPKTINQGINNNNSKRYSEKIYLIQKCNICIIFIQILIRVWSKSYQTVKLIGYFFHIILYVKILIKKEISSKRAECKPQPVLQMLTSLTIIYISPPFVQCTVIEDEIFHIFAGLIQNQFMVQTGWCYERIFHRYELAQKCAGFIILL